MAKNYESLYPCVCCGIEGEGVVTYHHIFTQKVYPEFKDEIWNQVSVCQKHHNMAHQKGHIFMADSFPGFKKWLDQNGWFLCPTVKKFRREGF